MGRLVIDGIHVYELDEECLKEKEQRKQEESNDTNTEEVSRKKSESV